MTVGVGVVHELAAALHDGLGLLGVLVRPVAHHEEGGLHVVLRQDIQDALGVVGAPGGVEADGADLFRAVHAVEGQRAVGGVAQGRPGGQVSGQAQAQDRGQDGRGADRSRQLHGKTPPFRESLCAGRAVYPLAKHRGLW